MERGQRGFKGQTISYGIFSKSSKYLWDGFEKIMEFSIKKRQKKGKKSKKRKKKWK